MENKRYAEEEQQRLLERREYLELLKKKQAEYTTRKIQLEFEEKKIIEETKNVIDNYSDITEASSEEEFINNTDHINTKDLLLHAMIKNNVIGPFSTNYELIQTSDSNLKRARSGSSGSTSSPQSKVNKSQIHPLEAVPPKLDYVLDIR